MRVQDMAPYDSLVLNLTSPRRRCLSGVVRLELQVSISEDWLREIFQDSFRSGVLLRKFFSSKITEYHVCALRHLSI